MTLTADFQVFTSALTVLKDAHPLFPGLPQTINGMPVVPAVASSTEQDLHEDTMSLTALQDMCDVPIGSSVFLNHDYTLPGSYFGRTVVSPMIVQQDGIADLHTAYAAHIKEDAARRVFEQIQDGARHGVSGGFMVTEWTFEGDPDDWFAPIIIVHVRKLEDSIVGIPANQRSWVENAIKGVFERSVRDDDGESALKLAPAYKGMFNRDYQDLVKGIGSQGLRKDLEKRPIRMTPRKSIKWDANKQIFLLQSSNVTKAIPATEVKEVLSTLQQEVAKQRLAMIEEKKAATGKTSWPLADRDAKWDGGAAKASIFEWAATDDGFDAGKAKQCFFYCDTEAGDDKKGSYKMPFCHVTDGKPEIIPQGVISCAGILNGAMGGLSDVPEADIEKIKGKVETIYNRINKEQGTDLEVPWKDKALKPDKTKESKNESSQSDPVVESADNNSDRAPDADNDPATDLGENGGDDSEVREDGDHSTEAATDTTPETPVEDDIQTKQAQLALEMRQLYLEQYNRTASFLGFAPVNLDGVKVQDANAITTKDAATALAFKAVEDLDLAIKSGAEFSKENSDHIKAIHDAIYNMVGPMHCSEAMKKDDAKDGDNDNDGEDANDEDTKATLPTVFDFTPVSKELTESLLKSFEPVVTSFNTVADRLKEVQLLPNIQADITVLTKQAGLLSDQFSLAQKQVNAVLKDVGTLKAMPLGNPKNLQRTVKAEEDPESTTNYQELLSVNQNLTAPTTLSECERFTSIKDVTLIDGSKIQCRHWPEGVGKGVRPELTMRQKSFMPLYTWSIYQEAGDAMVPMIDDPFEKVEA